MTPIYDVMSAYPAVGNGPNQWAEQDIKMAMALLREEQALPGTRHHAAPLQQHGEESRLRRQRRASHPGLHCPHTCNCRQGPRGAASRVLGKGRRPNSRRHSRRSARPGADAPRLIAHSHTSQDSQGSRGNEPMAKRLRQSVDPALFADPGHARIGTDQHRRSGLDGDAAYAPRGGGCQPGCRAPV